MTSRHIYLVAKGSYSDTLLATEQWQIGIRFRVAATDANAFGNLPTDTSYADESISRDETNWTIEGNYSANLGLGSVFNADDWLNDQVAPAFTTWLPATNFFPNKTQIDSLVAYGMEDGSVAEVGAGPAKVELKFKAGHKPIGASSTTALPPQCSVVASWMTAVAGRHGKGRIYLPAPTTAVVAGGGGLMSSTVQTGIATSTATLVGDLNYENIVGAVYAKAIVAGAPWVRYNLISAVRVGQVIDTQRRRRNQLVETYVSADV